MSILDDAIREHLELKRAHGADEAELKRLEDEAFGPPQRPDEMDPLAEAPTEFLTAPAEVVAEAAQAEAEEDGSRRVPNIADLQEGPPPAPVEEPPAPVEEPEAEKAEPPAVEGPAVEEQPAAEHQVIAEPSAPAPEPSSPEPPPAPDAVHTTEEREAIADQPTEMFDVQAEIEGSAAPTEPAPPSPSEPQPSFEEEDDDFFSEQRLSDELNQALEAPVTDEHEVIPQPDLPPLPEPPEPPRQTEPPAAAEPPSEEPPGPRLPVGETEEGTAIYNIESDEDDYEEDSGEHSVYEPETGSHDDVLEDTPDFLEDAPEDDDLWFEQRPPKDFDFDD